MPGLARLPTIVSTIADSHPSPLFFIRPSADLVEVIFPCNAGQSLAGQRGILARDTGPAEILGRQTDGAQYKSWYQRYNPNQLGKSDKIDGVVRQ
jgi:hypothetical protein